MKFEVDTSRKDKVRSTQKFLNKFLWCKSSYKDRTIGIGIILERSLISSKFRNLKLLQHIAFFMDARISSWLQFLPVDWDNVFFSILCYSAIIKSYNTECGIIGTQFLTLQFYHFNRDYDAWSLIFWIR